MVVYIESKDYRCEHELSSDSGIAAVNVRVTKQSAPVDVHVWGLNENDDWERVRGVRLGSSGSEDHLEHRLVTRPKILDDGTIFSYTQVEVRATGPVTEATMEEQA